MPYVHVSLSSKLDASQSDDLKTMLGQTIEILPGKSESVLMLRLDQDCAMYFRGQGGNCAHIAVHLFRASPEDKKQEFASEAVAGICRITGLDKDQVFMSIQEHDSWVAGGKLI